MASPATCLRRLALQRISTPRPVRLLHSSTAVRDAAVASAAPAAPIRRPVGAFRGGVFGFLLGAVLAGAGTFYYVMEEYRVSNELLTEDIYALQAAVQRIHTHVSTLEERIDQVDKAKGWRV